MYNQKSGSLGKPVIRRRAGSAHSAVRCGSALIVTLLLMGVLLTLTVGLSTLVIKELKQTADVVASGKAYYAAEAGIENALYELSTHLPGYETVGEEGENVWKEFKDEDFEYRYKIANKGDRYPYFEDDEPIFLTPTQAVTKDTLYASHPGKTYNALALNQTVTIPLFTDNGDGTYTDVDEFLVQYYVDFDLDDDIYDIVEAGGIPIKLEYFDVLRWKVFGNPRPEFGGDTKKTDAISDFYPAMTGDSAIQPVCIGSSMDLLSDDEYRCNAPVAKENARVEQSWSWARECYLNEVTDRSIGIVESAEDKVLDQCNIAGFVGSHTRNYVSITNIVNPDIIGINPILYPERANIYYRVIALSDAGGAVAGASGAASGAPKLVREFADIKADGFAAGGEIRQSIDVNMRASSFLPVFNFSLYRTDTKDDAFSPEE